MKIRMITSVMALALGLVVTSASACPGDEKGVKKTAELTKSPCSGATTTVADKAPCSGKKAITVAAKGGCGKDCDKPCCRDAKTGAAKKKGCCGKSAALTSAHGGCPIAKKANAVLTSLPTMKYRVGEETTGCSQSAAAMAEKTGKKIQYVVGDDVLANEGEAMVKLTSLIEAEVEAMQSMQFVAGGECGRCPATAKSIAKKAGTKVVYRVGGVDFDSKENAEAALVAIKEAVAKVAMEYKVDGKTFGCSKSAGAKCKETGKKLTYVVGKEETSCQTTAKLNLAKAKVRKIVETAAAKSFAL